MIGREDQPKLTTRLNALFAREEGMDGISTFFVRIK